jgi:hypothetical protein
VPDVAPAELDAAQNAILVTGTTYELSLHAGDPGGTGANEASGGSYARQAITFAASSGGSQASNNAQVVPAPALQSTSLAAAITSTTQTAVTLAAVVGPSSGQWVILVDSEQMLVTAGDGTTAITVQRGYNNTTAATHVNGATVTVLLDHFGIWTAAGVYLRGGPLTAPIDTPPNSTVTFASGAITLTAS